MNPLEVIRTSFGAILQNRFRALLTMLGIAIGVAAVISVLAVGRGAEETVRKQIEQIAAAHLAVQGFWDSQARRYYPLTLDDAEALRTQITGAQYVVPSVYVGRSIRYQGHELEANVGGMPPETLAMYRLQPEIGRLYSESDELLKRRVVVVGAAIGANIMARSRRVIGEMVRIGGRTFEVIGVLREAENIEIIRFRPNDMVFIPYETALSSIGASQLGSILIRARSNADVERVAMEAERILRRSKRLTPGEPNTFRIFNIHDLGMAQEEASKTFSELLTAIAAISLLVGGLGIVNIMLVSVTERTREIGIRKALGARRLTILTQFLTEAAMLCLIGGLIGVGAGYAFAHTVVAGAGWSVIVTPGSITLGVVVAVIVGLIAGVWPAVRAAQLAPVEALRWE